MTHIDIRATGIQHAPRFQDQGYICAKCGLYRATAADLINSGSCPQRVMLSAPNEGEPRPMAERIYMHTEVFERLDALTEAWGLNHNDTISALLDMQFTADLIGIAPANDTEFFDAAGNHWVRANNAPGFPLDRPEIERPPEPDTIPVVFCEPTGVIVHTATGWLMVVPRLGHSQAATSPPRISSSGGGDDDDGFGAEFPEKSPKSPEPPFTNPKDRDVEAGLPYPQRLKERVDQCGDWLVRLDQRVQGLASKHQAAFDAINDTILPRLGAVEDRVSEAAQAPGGVHPARVREHGFYRRISIEEIT